MSYLGVNLQLQEPLVRILGANGEWVKQHLRDSYVQENLSLCSRRLGPENRNASNGLWATTNWNNWREDWNANPNDRDTYVSMEGPNCKVLS